MRQRDEAKRRAILDGTLSVVGRQGLAGLSMEAVAKAAGVAIGTVYIYFDNKEALLNALYLETKLEVSRAIFEGASEGEPVRRAFERMCIGYMRYVAAHRAEVVLMAQLQNSPFLFEQTRERSQKTSEPLIHLLERAKREGLLKDMATPLMIAFLHATLAELAGFVAAEPKRSIPDRHAEIARMCWDALKA